MTQDEIIEMAKQFCPYYSEELRGAYYDGFMKASKLVAQYEREEIAQFIEQTRLGSLPLETALHYATLLGSYATAIRARGQA